MVERIDPRIEQPTRELLHFVYVEDLEGGERTMRRVTGDGDLFTQVLTLIGRVASVAVVRRCDDKPPTGDDLAEIATEVVEFYSGSYPLEYADVLAYLERVLFGNEPADAVLGVDKAFLVPLVVTVNLLDWASQFEEVGTWHEYLDVLEAGLEESGNTSYLTAQDSKRT